MSNLNCWLKSQTKCTFIDLILGFELKVKWVFPQSSLQLICCILIFKVLSVSLYSPVWCCFCFCVAIGAVFPTEFEFIWFLWLHFVSVSPNIIFFPFQRILCLIQTLNVPSHSFDRIDYDFADVFFISSLSYFAVVVRFAFPSFSLTLVIGSFRRSPIVEQREKRKKNKANLFCKFELSENVGKRKTDRYRQKWNANDTEIFICLEHNLIQVCCILFMMMVMMKMTVLSR